MHHLLSVAVTFVHQQCPVPGGTAALLKWHKSGVVQVERDHQETTGISGLFTCLIWGLEIVPWAGKNMAFWSYCAGGSKPCGCCRQLPERREAGDTGRLCGGHRAAHICEDKIASHTVARKAAPPPISHPLRLGSFSCFVQISKHWRNLAKY